LNESCEGGPAIIGSDRWDRGSEAINPIKKSKSKPMANYICCTWPLYMLKRRQLAARGEATLGRLRRSGNRQFVAAFLIFALMLQSMALAVAAGRLTAAGAIDPNWAGFEICHHDGAGDDGNAAVPGGAPVPSGAHCLFCLTGAAHALEAPLPSPEFHLIIITVVPWTLPVWRLPVVTVDASARPRGPPVA
jgi:hypothetical protein